MFPRDPYLKELLRSGPAVAATLQKLWGFLMSRTADDCLRTIERYVTEDIDGGLTKRSLRFCCGLADEATAPAHVAVERSASVPCFDPVANEMQKLETQSSQLINYALESGREYLSADLVKNWPRFHRSGIFQWRPESMCCLHWHPTDCG